MTMMQLSETLENNIQRGDDYVGTRSILTSQRSEHVLD